MRLREMKHVVNTQKAAIYSLDIDQKGSASQINVVNWDLVLRAVSELKKIGVLDFVIDPIIGDDQFGSHFVNSFNMSNKLASRLDSYYKNLINAFDILDAILDKMVEPQPELTLSLKLYELGEFKELNEFISNFQKRILAPLNYLNESVEVGELESGSKWINLTLKSYLGFQLLTSVISSSFDLLIHDYQRYRIAAEIVDQYVSQNNESNGFKTFIESQMEELFMKRASIIFEELKEMKDLPAHQKKKLLELNNEQINELRVTLVKSLEETTRQIDKGLEIYEALDKPKEERLHIQLPNFSKLLSLRKEGKLLTLGR